MKLGAKIFGALSGILLLFLLFGLFLPGTWEAEVEGVLPASASEVFPFMARPDQWMLWNPMPESGSELVGPQQGVGAGIGWDDPEYGKGQFLIQSIEEDRRVDYEVQIEGGALVILGSLSLIPNGSETRLQWVERGDFGWNPLLGYAARGMGNSQAEVMRSKLDALRALLEGD